MKTVVITGAHGAIGGGIARALGGYDLRTPSSKELDLTDEKAVTAWYAALPELWASIHVAGAFAMKPTLDTTLEDLRAMHRINFETAFLCCREAVRRGAKRIVNVAARPAVVATGGMLAYATSKAAVASLTTSLAAELPGVLVNAILPSTVDTPANRASMPSADFARWPKVEELAAAVKFLVSDENTVTSGALLPVYGRA